MYGLGALNELMLKADVGSMNGLLYRTDSGEMNGLLCKDALKELEEKDIQL